MILETQLKYQRKFSKPLWGVEGVGGWGMANCEGGGGNSEGSFNTIPPFGIPDPTDKAWFCSRNWAANFLIAFSGILSSNLSENTDSDVKKFNFIIIRGTSHKPNKEKHGNLFHKISILWIVNFQLKYIILLISGALRPLSRFGTSNLPPSSFLTGLIGFFLALLVGSSPELSPW